MRLLRGFALSIVLVSLMAGIGYADYKSDKDVKLSLTVAPSILRTSSWTGTTMFEAQETIHNTLTASTGTSVDHYYTWVYINGEPVLIVDPIWVDAT